MSPALTHIVHIAKHVKRSASDQKRGHALYAALSNAIESGLDFAKGDFVYLRDKLHLSAWIGDGGVDRMYSTACGKERASENLSAVLAIEHMRKRDPFMWAEETRTAKRLCIGSRFTWKGVFVTVTSFDDSAKTLTACSYKRERDTDGEDGIGKRSYFKGKYRTLEALKECTDGSLIVRFSPPVEYEPEKVDRRFTITCTELNELRKDYDHRRRVHEKAISAATTLDAVEVARVAAAAEGKEAYRHFDIEILTEAVTRRKEEIEAEMTRAERELSQQEQKRRWEDQHADNLVKWLAGEDVRDFINGGDVRIRVKGDYVETSNGNRVTVDAARMTLAFVAKHRESGWTMNGRKHDVDAFKLERVDSDGIQIGCTFFPWSEVDRCAELLKEYAHV